jgi:signal transduction histidine kinase
VALSSLHDEILRVSRLVADLETLASADAATFDLDCGPVALRPLLQDAAQEFAGIFAERGLRLVLQLDDDIEIEADTTRVRQVTSNLLANATKFTPPGGEVRLELERDGPWAVIRVVDTGPGIPADEMSSVFDRFFRGRAVRAGGSGIGLAIVRRLVTAHGGDVEVASESGGGATFTVRLPQTARSLLTSFTGSS